MLSRRNFLIAAAATPIVASFATPSAAAQDAIYATNGIAINGYDPVAYFTDETHVEGSADFTHDWMGATWQFASAEARDQFAAAPEDFAPQYGGYCAYAVSKGSTATTSPNAWHIHEGKLYLNFNRTVRTIWRQDIPGNIMKANANWPGVLA